MDITANKTAADSLDFLDAYLATQSAPPGDAASTGQSASRRDSIEWCSPIDPVARSSLWFTDDRSEAAALEKALGNTDVPDGTFVVHPNPDPAVGPSIGLAYRCVSAMASSPFLSHTLVTFRNGLIIIIIIS